MIIVKLMGGLGNQMFQYAAGRRLAMKHNTILKLDLSFLLDRTPRENFAYRDYDIGIFNIQENFVNTSEIKEFFPNKRHFIYRIKRKLKFINIIKEPSRFNEDFHFYNEILSAPNNTYLEGYWQSEKFFKDIEDIIKRDFTIRPKMDSLNEKYAKEIISSESVSIHIRKGDYIHNPIINEVYNTCNLDYYMKSMKKIIDCVENPTFFLFSDDPMWVKENFNLENTFKIITHNRAEKSYEDLRLMSLCKHNIIANSSFSWWGAWLNENPKKIIIAPENWFNYPSINTDDLIPKTWIRI